jgi:hydrogenase nickel incorporation protein HypA/HybF
MHELSIARSIVAIVCERAGGEPVKRVTLEVGELAGVMVEAIAFCFPIVSDGTSCAGAALEVRTIAARARCRTCAAEFAYAHLAARCACGSRDIEPLSGHELNVKEMELEAV